MEAQALPSGLGVGSPARRRACGRRALARRQRQEPGSRRPGAPTSSAGVCKISCRVECKNSHPLPQSFLICD